MPTVAYVPCEMLYLSGSALGNSLMYRFLGLVSQRNLRHVRFVPDKPWQETLTQSHTRVNKQNVLNLVSQPYIQ